MSDWPRMMTRRQAAKYTGLAEATLASMACRGGGPPMYRLGRAVRYKRDELDRYLAGRHVAEPGMPADSVASCTRGNC